MSLYEALHHITLKQWVHAPSMLPSDRVIASQRAKFLFRLLIKKKKKKKKFPSEIIHFLSYPLQSERKCPRAETDGSLQGYRSSFAGYVEMLTGMFSPSRCTRFLRGEVCAHQVLCSRFRYMSVMNPYRVSSSLVTKCLRIASSCTWQDALLSKHIVVMLKYLPKHTCIGHNKRYTIGAFLSGQSDRIVIPFYGNFNK